MTERKKGDTLEEPMMRCARCKKIFAKSLIDEKEPYCPNEIGLLGKHRFMPSKEPH
jgi:hypothetical protein